MREFVEQPERHLPSLIEAGLIEPCPDRRSVVARPEAFREARIAARKAATPVAPPFPGLAEGPTGPLFASARLSHIPTKSSKRATLRRYLVDARLLERAADGHEYRLSLID